MPKSSLPMVLSTVAVVACSSMATSKAALLYEFTFENGTTQSLANTGSHATGQNATSLSFSSPPAPGFTSNVPLTANNDWAYNLPSSTGINGSILNLPDSTAQLRLTNTTDQLTVAMWVNLDGTTEREAGLAGNQDSVSGTGWSFWVQESNSSYKLQFTVDPTVGGSQTRSYAGTSAVPIDTWAHVAVTYQNQIPTFYINGVSVGSGSAFSTTAGTNTESLRIGSQLQNSAFIDGMADNVMFYDTALNASQIASLAATVPEPGVAAAFLGSCALLGLRRRARV
jgi:hypothetical protein